MKAKAEYRDRDETEVAVLDALADRGAEGMTIFELRSRVEITIDELEDALAALKSDGLIEVTEEQQRTVILPDEKVIGSGEQVDERSFLEYLRDRLPF